MLKNKNKKTLPKKKILIGAAIAIIAVIVAVGDIVNVKVIGIDQEKQKVSLSMKEV